VAAEGGGMEGCAAVILGLGVDVGAAVEQEEDSLYLIVLRC